MEGAGLWTLSPRISGWHQLLLSSLLKCSMTFCLSSSLTRCLSCWSSSCRSFCRALDLRRLARRHLLYRSHSAVCCLWLPGWVSTSLALQLWLRPHIHPGNQARRGWGLRHPHHSLRYSLCSGTNGKSGTTGYFLTSDDI